MKKVFLLLMVALLLVLIPTVALAADAVAVETGTAVVPSMDVIMAKLAEAVAVFFAIWILAMVVERIIELVKAKLAPKKASSLVWFLITSAIGILICVPSGLNMLGFLGLNGIVVEYTFRVLTGIAIGAGSGFVHSLQTKFNESKTFATSVNYVVENTGGDPDEDAVETPDELHDTSDGSE
jgi:hypothetical protein